MSFKHGNTMSLKHGFDQHSHYDRWINIIARCTNSKNKDYPDYGGRGISVCEEWRGEVGLKAFCEWADKTYTSRTILDRRDNNKKDRGYSPENCRWVTYFKSTDNRRQPKRKYDLPKGVYPCGYKYQASITKRQTTIYLGTFDTTEEASQTYELARMEWVKENTT